jgi:hypothetical protein
MRVLELPVLRALAPEATLSGFVKPYCERKRRQQQYE